MIGLVDKRWKKRMAKPPLKFKVVDIESGKSSLVECPREMPDFEIQQFTGLLDSKGQEIYWGDVVLWNGNKYAVEWSLEEACYEIVSDSDIDDWIMDLGVVAKFCTIIGNKWSEVE